jgi:hypothetical protein
MKGCNPPMYHQQVEVGGHFESCVEATCAIRWQDFLTQAARLLGLRLSANRRVAGYPVTGLPFA